MRYFHRPRALKSPVLAVRKVSVSEIGFVMRTCPLPIRDHWIDIPPFEAARHLVYRSATFEKSSATFRASKCRRLSRGYKPVLRRYLNERNLAKQIEREAIVVFQADRAKFY